MSAQFDFLEVRQTEAIAWVTIDRQQDRNSLNSPVMHEIARLMDMLEKNGSKAVVFSGAGESYFIGGADGIEMMTFSSEEAHAFSSRIQGLLNRMEAGPLMTVAAINGLCFGGGFEFALACDLRVAGPRARIGLPEVKVGLIPGGGGTQRLPRLIGLGKALELILSGRLVKAPEAERLGLIHVAVEDDDLTVGVDQLLSPILKNPQYALTLAKQAVYASNQGGMEFGLTVERERFSRCFERSYFQDLMRQQIKDGILTTSETVPV
jgi:enoyl-CoA hydratase